MKRYSCALLVAVIGCGVGTPPASRLKLQLSSSTATDGTSSRLQMQAGETKTVVLMAVGADASVTFSARDLPAFATLAGPLLTLSPGRADAGSYTLTFTAQSGQDSANAVLDLEVSRFNTPPDEELWGMAEGAQNRQERDVMVGTCPGPQTCTVQYPWLQFFVSDAEGDGIYVEVEVVTHGQPFTKTATFSAHVNASYPRNDTNLFIPMFGLTPEVSYDFAYRVRDDFGAISVDHIMGATAADGWTSRPIFAFDQGPCITRQCACLPSTWPNGVHPRCGIDLDCGSGVCDTTTLACK